MNHQAKLTLLYPLLIGILQSKLREESDAKEHILEMLFSVNEDSAALGWILMDAIKLDLSAELEVFEANLINSSDRYFVCKGSNEKACFRFPEKALTGDWSWQLWDIHSLSPLIKYRKNLSHLTISMEVLKYWWRDRREKKIGKMSYLPDEIGALTNLIYLRISRMPLVVLPESIVKLGKLERLILTHTQLSELPLGMAALQNLKMLILSENQFQSLPVEIGKLKNLQVFEIGNNPLQYEQIPASLFDESHSNKAVAKALRKFFAWKQRKEDK